MPVPVVALLAMQAGGMIIDWLGKQSQIEMAERGAKLQQQAIEDAIRYSRMQNEEESLQSMRKLRQNLGTQAAYLAARGIRSGTATGVLMMTESVGNFNADERIRKINQLSQEAGMRAGIQMSKMHQEAYKSGKESEFFKSAIERIPTNPEFYKQFGKDTGSYGLTRARPIG